MNAKLMNERIEIAKCTLLALYNGKSKLKAFWDEKNDKFFFTYNNYILIDDLTLDTHDYVLNALLPFLISLK